MVQFEAGVTTALPPLSNVGAVPVVPDSAVLHLTGSRSGLTRLSQKRPLERVTTGLPDLDTLLEGGLPKGRIVEVFGGESSGKTSFIVQSLAQTQRAGGTAALIEPENSLDPAYAARLGVQLDNVLYGLPQTGDEAIQMIADLITRNACDLIALDSIAALVPKLENGTFYDESFQHAYMLSQGLRYLNNLLAQAERPCTLLFANQLRFSGGKNTPTGGQTLGFFASLRLEFKKGVALKGAVPGSKISVIVRKSKVSRPQGAVALNLLSGQGLVSV